MTVMTERDKWIRLISDAGDRYGSTLIALMDRYNVNKLPDISEEQAKTFYLNEVKHEQQPMPVLQRNYS